MLDELRIHALGVIDEAVLPLGPGLTVVTGETGAGKTMVVTGLLLLFGGRGDAARIRTGADQATVDGRLHVAGDGAAAARVRDAGGELDDDGTLVLRRTVSAAGRSRAYVGGAPAPVGVLTELAQRLVAVHGQSDQLRLSRPAEQRGALDQYAALDTTAYARAFEQWRAAQARLSERTDRARELQREADVLAHGIAEIDQAQIDVEQDEQLNDVVGRLGHAESLRFAALTAHDALLGSTEDVGAPSGDAAALLGQAQRALRQLAELDPALDGLAGRLEDLSASVTELGADLSAYAEGLAADPERLAQTQARISTLTGLRRKYGEDLGEVLHWRAEAADRLADLDVSEEALATLRAELAAAADTAGKLASELSLARSAAAGALAESVSAELTGLAMPRAQVRIAVTRRPVTAGAAALVVEGEPAGAGPDGVDDVEFRLQPHPDAPELPLQRGASGGELSRVMLAIEVSLAGTDPVPTMVFDEVDAGVGGRAALEVGRRLARLAARHQVIVVTHLAQVAAYADRHIVVDKPLSATESGVTRSDVRVVEDEDRLTELARMLSGNDSATARQHAAELLSAAQHDRSVAIAPAAAKKRKRPARPRGETDGP